ncbi:heavy metal-binding domain-containing protein [Tenacibaculum salmonis]|uniref:heavy metal-binding domain-containing protein n=1 Tax=Tenacibaculum sp. P3-BQ1 TaxID=3232310 RepID=UPI0034DE5A5E
MNLLNNNSISKTILAVLVIGLTLSTVSCKDAKKEHTTTEKTSVEKKGKEYTSAYVCPMHCEDSGSDKEGKCPTCGMTYIDNKIHSANGHKH